MQAFLQRTCPSPTSDQIADIRLAASKMTGATRRAFEAEMTVQYCRGNARFAARIFGWGRHTVELGFAERRTVLLCLGFRLRKVVKTKLYKKIKQTDAIFDNIKKRCPSQGLGRRQTLAHGL
jgi:hypothetical protein